MILTLPRWYIWWSDLKWVDQVNYTVQKAWKAIHFVMCVLKKGNRNTKSLAYMSLVSYSWIWVCMLGSMHRRTDKCVRWVQKKAAQFINHTKYSDWETLAQHRTIARLWAILKCTQGNRLGKLYATGCEGLTVWAALIMFRKLGTGSRDRISGSIPL